MKLIAHAVKNLQDAKKALRFGCTLLEVDISQNVFTGNFNVQHDALKGKFAIGPDPFELLNNIEEEQLLLDLKAAKYSLNFKSKFKRLIKGKTKNPKITGIDLKIISEIARNNNAKVYYGFLNKKSVDYFWQVSKSLYRPAGFSIKKDLIDKDLILRLKSEYPKSEILAWTVDDKNEMERLKNLGVEGIITDNWKV